MTQIKTLILAGLLLASAPVIAAESDVPLAVTTLAHASVRTTPTYEQTALSRKYLQSGLELLRGGQAQRAVQDFNDSVRLAPDAENFKALGTAYYQAGNRRKAVWAYRESLLLEPDPKVQALVDSLADPRGSGAQASYRTLLDQASREVADGRIDQAIQDYRDAYGIEPGPESAGPCLRLAADAVEGYLSRADLASAVEDLCRVEAIKRAQDADAPDALARLDKAEARAVRWTGMSLRENQKAMLAGQDAWVRLMRYRAASGEPGR